MLCTGNYDAFEKTREEKLEKMSSIQHALDIKRQHVEESIKKMEVCFCLVVAVCCVSCACTQSGFCLQQAAMHTKKGADDKRLKQVTSRKKKLGRMGSTP